MRTTIRASAWLGAALAAVLLFGAAGASAHEYFLGDDTPVPVSPDGKRHISVNVGRTITLTVKNAPMQSCLANIGAAGFSDIISVTSPQNPGAIDTREFRITGRTAGSTEIDLTVQGVDPCIENTHNPIVVDVLPSETEILRSYSLAYKSESKLLKGTLKFELGALGEYSSSVLDAFKDGSAAPDAAARALLDGWYQTYGDGYFSARDTVKNLVNYGGGQLTAGGWQECTSPLGFTDGLRGPFDLLVANAQSQLGGFQAKLDKQITSDIANYRKIGAGYGISFTSSYRLGGYPAIDVSGPTTSQRPDDPDVPLHIGYAGAATWSTEFDTMSCLVFAGLASPASGPVRIELFDGNGLVDSKLVDVEGKGVWDAFFDDLVAGKTYRAQARYNGGAPGHATDKIFLSRLRADF